ncbi:hypothetical protein GGX14DRAFT_386103 [Mycena pura]|uniref:Uncharacterized protein n=1 Tax=Mycena pura TaxID=153505 RepID=A0AAD6YRW1_9AGAR|nr:hypothetical protein GGX14DRAFT_386103 [Mycena pura]
MYASTRKEWWKAEKAVSEPDPRDARQPSATVGQYTRRSPNNEFRTRPAFRAMGYRSSTVYWQRIRNQLRVLARRSWLTTSASRDGGSDAVRTSPHWKTTGTALSRGTSRLLLKASYGVTKRAKWKAERVAYDRELQGLREKEDQRRAASGLPVCYLTHSCTMLMSPSSKPLLSESPDDVQAWEQSLIDEQVIPPCAPDPTPMDPLRGRSTSPEVFDVSCIMIARLEHL